MTRPATHPICSARLSPERAKGRDCPSPPVAPHTPKLRVLDLFAGIGGFSLGLERTGGFETAAFCEREPYPRQILAQWWPEVPIYDDVCTLTAERLAADGIAVDVITGGFPCQDISFAGKGAGLAGERSGLFYEVARLIGELEPRFVILENVSALLSRGLDAVLGTLASLGYDAEWHCIPASYLGAPHRRDRIWIVAFPNGRNGQPSPFNRSGIRSAIAGEGADADTCGAGYEPETLAHASRLQRNGGELYGEHGEGEVSELGNGSGTIALAHTNRPRLEGRALAGNAGEVGPWVQQFIERCPDSDRRAWCAEPNVGRVANGVPDRAHRLKALGNAVVPQIPELIGRAILEAVNSHAAPITGYAA